MTGAHPPDDLRQNTAFFGRSEELYQLVRNLHRGRHTLILGEKGIGKSRLVTEAKWILMGRIRRIDFAPYVLSKLRNDPRIPIDSEQYKVLSIEHSNPLGECLRELAEQLYHEGDLRIETGEERSDWAVVRKRISAMGSVRLQAAVFEAISGSDKPYLILFDNLDRISPSQQEFLETLLNIAVICAAVVEMKENFVFKRIWASFSKITLDPLPESVCMQLIGHFYEHYPFHIADPELYRREILKAANGNGLVAHLIPFQAEWKRSSR